MTTYNTGNPIGSTDPKDLFDNAQNFDDAVNGPGLTWVDRLGVTRPTWQGAIDDAATRAEFAASDGAFKVGYLPAGTGAVATDVQSKLREFVSVKDFGAVGDGVADDTAAIQAALAAHSTVFMPVGTFRISANINIGGKRLLGAGKHKTTIVCFSPTTNGRFGGVTANQAAVYTLGTTGNTVQGGEVSDLTIHCSGLLNATGSTGLKGVMFYKSHGCHAKNVKVIDSRSYAFWCVDAVGATDYASAVFEDCEESGSEIGFEAVNVSTCSFVRCKSEKPLTSTSWPIFSMFHAYGLSDSALVTFDNCYGRGHASTVVDLALKCRNVQFVGGYFEQLTAGNGCLFFTFLGGDFASIEFGNAVFRSAGFGGVLVKGDQAPSGAKAAKFIGGSISANQGVGLEIQDSNVTLEFVGTDVSSTTTTGAAALCFVSEGTGNVVQFTGGALRAVGGAGTAVSQGVTMRISDQTIQVPSTSVAPRVRQVVYGSGALQANGDYTFLNMIFPSASTPTRVVVTAMIDATGAANGLAAANQAATFSFIPLDNQVYRLYAPLAAAGRSVRWQMVEYET
jgi:hypothetical protein